jgi:hypothetical protein
MDLGLDSVGYQYSHGPGGTWSHRDSAKLHFELQICHTDGLLALCDPRDQEIDEPTGIDNFTTKSAVARNKILQAADRRAVSVSISANDEEILFTAEAVANYDRTGLRVLSIAEGPQAK